MKLTIKNLKKIIKEELNEMFGYRSVTQMLSGYGYGAVGGITTKRPQSYGQYDYNNGVIGVIEPDSMFGSQYYPSDGRGNLGEVIKALENMGYKNVGMALPASNKDPESLIRMASYIQETL